MFSLNSFVSYTPPKIQISTEIRGARIDISSIKAYIRKTTKSLKSKGKIPLLL